MAANPTIAAATGTPVTPATGTPAVPAEAPSFAILRQYWPQLKRLLPSHVVPDAWYSAVYAALYRGKNPAAKVDLWRAANANPESLMFALFDAARQGLEPGTEHYYLTPRPNRNATNGVEVLGIRGYQGEIELIYRAGAVSSVVVEVVRENDEYRYERGIDRMPVHRFPKFARKADRGPLIGVYAYGVMVDGSISRVVELNQDDIDRAKRASGSAKFGTSFWNDADDEAAMWLKTGVHRLQKFVPTSAEFRRIAATTEATGHAVGAVAGKTVLDAQSGAALPDAIASAQRAALPGGTRELNAASPLAGPPEQAPPAPLDETTFAQPPADEDEEPDGDAAEQGDSFWGKQDGAQS